MPSVEGSYPTEVPLPGPFEASASCLWMRGGEGIAGWGEAVRIEPGTGPDRFASVIPEIADALAGRTADGVAFGVFTFDPEIPGSVVVIPEVVAHHAAGDGWVGGSNGAGVGRATTNAPATEVRYAGSSISELAWLDAVDAATKSIAAGELEKVVLARDIHIWSKTPFPVPAILARLARRFPECYTFCCDGFIGATPELLIAKRGPVVSSLVLAGSAARGEGRADRMLGEALLASVKDNTEHRLSVASVTEALAPFCDDVEAGTPYLLKLANVQHIATAISARVDPALHVLSLVDALHPTAAVCGTPTTAAMDLIRSSEGMDRGRYAGPVGWVDAAGDGEWGIALRCAEISGTRGRLFAGAGIVAASEPAAELEETRLKLRAMMSALESPSA